MSGSTNFLQWNPNALNQESDSTYNGDSLRAGGIPSGTGGAGVLAPSVTHNKLYYQLTTFITALAQALTVKGYSPSDGSNNPTTAISNLAGVFANIMTQADMSPYALISMLAPYTPLTAFTQLQASTGYLFLPGNLLIQWVTGAIMAGGDDQLQTLVFAQHFNSTPFFAIASLYELDNAASDAHVNIVSGSLSTVQLQIQLQNSGITGRVQPCALVIGVAPPH